MSALKNPNFAEESKNSQINTKNMEAPKPQSKETDNSTKKSTNKILNFSGKEHLNSAMALIIIPEMAVNEEENQDGNKTDRPLSASSQTSNILSTTQVVSNTEEEEKEEQYITSHESTTLFQTCIPYLPIEIAVICLIFNILIPGFGSILCGISNFCCGKMQETVKKEDVPMKAFINLLVGFMQLLTVTFLLVGWFWSLAWGIKIVLLSIENRKKTKRKLLKAKQKKTKFSFHYAVADPADADDDEKMTPKLKY